MGIKILNGNAKARTVLISNQAQTFTAPIAGKVAVQSITGKVVAQVIITGKVV